MKLVLFLAIFSVSCGFKNAYNDVHELQADVDQLQRENSEQQTEIDALNARLLALESSIAVDIAVLQATDTTLQNQINNMQTAINNQLVQLTTLQASVLQLQAADNVNMLLDPCGNAPGFDEVLLRMTSGKVVAYFESSGKRFLSVLTPNQAYVTTDGSNCQFSVDSAGNLH